MKKEELDELSEKLSYEEINYIQIAKGNQHLTKVREKIEKQCPSQEELISEMSEKQYVETLIEIGPHLKLRFRSLTPSSFDESLDFASNNTETRGAYERSLSRRRLSYALMELNGRKPCPKSVPSGSYFDYAAEVGYDQLEKDLIDYADENYKVLGHHGLFDKISETFGLWESVIHDRINDIKDMGEILGN
jgi:hypothetical protein